MLFTPQAVNEKFLALLQGLPAKLDARIPPTPMGSLILLITHCDGRGQILLKEAYGGSFFLDDGINEFFARCANRTSSSGPAIPGDIRSSG